MVEFLFTEDNISVDSEEQSSEYFYDVKRFYSVNLVNFFPKIRLTRRKILNT